MSTILNKKVTAMRQIILRFLVQGTLKTLLARHSGDDRWLHLYPLWAQLLIVQIRELYAAFDANRYEMPVIA